MCSQGVDTGNVLKLEVETQVPEGVIAGACGQPLERVILVISAEYG